MDTTKALSTGLVTLDSGWGTVQLNINLVTVQGNMNLVLGVSAEEIAKQTHWGNPNMNSYGLNVSLPAVWWRRRRMFEVSSQRAMTVNCTRVEDARRETTDRILAGMVDKLLILASGAGD